MLDNAVGDKGNHNCSPCLVERLREPKASLFYTDSTMRTVEVQRPLPIEKEAAAEIERLQARVKELEGEIDRLKLGSTHGRIRIISRGSSIRASTLALAELLCELCGPGAEISYVPDGSEGGWSVWTEGEEWPDEDDSRYHLFALEVKRLRRERKARTLLNSPEPADLKAPETER